MGASAYWIKGPWRGCLAIVPRPRGGDWLLDEARVWRESGFDEIVSLLTAGEVTEFALNQEEQCCKEYGIQFRSFPIPDRGVPASVNGFAHFVQEIEKAVNAGKKIGLHCRQGIGRSSLMAAALLMSAGESPEAAWEAIRVARGCPVPDTIEQRNWVKDFAQAHQA